MAKVAVPLESCPDPSIVDPLLNVTVPVGVALAEAEETFAVKVTLVPTTVSALDRVNVAVVVTWKLAVTD